MNQNTTYIANISKEAEFKKELKKIGFEFFNLNYGFWRATNNKHILSFYKNGNLLIQGKEIDKIVDMLIEKNFIVFAKKLSKDRRKDLKLPKWIGVDESGKGDYFGPLVIAGVMVKNEIKDRLMKLGVRDSKNLSDKTAGVLAEKIKELCLFSVVIINPLRYNELLERMRNLNRLLAWGHSRTIENILEKESCRYAISDQFGDEKYIINAMMKKGKKIKLEQRHYAEEDTAVAAASILARDKFIKRLKELSKDYKIDLPKGASNKVIETGRGFVKKYGKDRLKEVAKIHFKTTSKLLA